MTTDVLPSSRHHIGRVHEGRLAGLSSYAVPLGRVLFALIFLMSAPMHFTAQGVQYAAGAGVPLPQIAVPLSGALALFGGLSVLLGYHARFGALLLVLFLVPVTLMMHAFWAVGDPGEAQVQQIMFMKNVSMLGAALLVLHWGSGPFSLDARRSRT